MQLKTAGLILLKDRKILLAYSRNKKCFYLPGGKIDAGETAESALCREIREELNIDIHEDELQFYTHVSAPAFGEAAGIIMEQDCYILDRPVKPIAAAEIAALEWFTLEAYLEQPVSAPGAVALLKMLRDDNIID